MDLQSLAEISSLNDAVVFAIYAEMDKKKWDSVEGITIEHKKYGQGIVKKYDPNGPYINIKFENLEDGKKEKEFTPGAFLKGLFVFPNLEEVLLDWDSIKKEIIQQIFKKNEIQKSEEWRKTCKDTEREYWEAKYQAELSIWKIQMEREARDANFFKTLQEKYLFGQLFASSPTSPLYPILMKIEDRDSYA